MKVILLYGEDSELLKIRATMLELSRYRVLLASSREEAEDLLVNSRVDLIVTCHTVNVLTRDSLLDTLGTISPKTFALTLSAGRQAAPHPLHANVDTSAGPAALVKAIQDLCTRQGAS